MYGRQWQQPLYKTPSLSLPPSLSLSFRSQSLSLFLSFSLSLFLSLSLSGSLCHSLCPSLSHTHSLSLSLTCSFAFPLYPSSVFTFLCLCLRARLNSLSSLVFSVSHSLVLVFSLVHALCLFPLSVSSQTSCNEVETGGHGMMGLGPAASSLKDMPVWTQNAWF